MKSGCCGLTTLRIRGVFDTNLADKKRNPNPNVQRLSEKRPLDAPVSTLSLVIQNRHHFFNSGYELILLNH